MKQKVKIKLPYSFEAISDYPWAGSLRPVSNKLLRRDHVNRRGYNALTLKTETNGLL